MDKDDAKIKETEKKPLSPKSQPEKPTKNNDFKRKYFEFYDDIKISDRQDW